MYFRVVKKTSGTMEGHRHCSTTRCVTRVLLFLCGPIDVLKFKNVLNYSKQSTRPTFLVVRLLSSSALRVFLPRWIVESKVKIMTIPRKIRGLRLWRVTFEILGIWPCTRDWPRTGRQPVKRMCSHTSPGCCLACSWLRFLARICVRPREVKDLEHGRGSLELPKTMVSSFRLFK